MQTQENNLIPNSTDSVRAHSWRWENVRQDDSIKWYDVNPGVQLHREGYTEFLKDFKKSDNIRFGYWNFLMTM